VKKENVEIDSAASSGGQGKYIKYVNFHWSPLEAALSIYNFSLFVCFKNKPEKELISARNIPTNDES
jgi:hypothetical protein